MRRSDFVLKPYAQSSNLRATGQLLNTLIPYGLLWLLLAKLPGQEPLLALPVLALMVLFSARCFSLMHDCGHYALFESRGLNRAAGFLFGIVNAIPQYPWSRGHAFHHKHNGDWEKYKGPSALVSTEEYQGYSSFGKKFYAFLRHPLMLFPGGFFYLIIKPRLALLLGCFGFFGHGLSQIRQGGFAAIPNLFKTYKSKHWYTTAEFWDLLFNNIGVITLWLLMGAWLGHGRFWISYSVVMTFSAAIFICIFFVQHNFEGSYAHRTEGWSYDRGAIEGSSYLKMPAIFNWFSADIGYHNIHHLSEFIPNYNLRACHERNAHLLRNVKVLRMGDIPSCFRYILWNRETNSLEVIP